MGAGGGRYPWGREKGRAEGRSLLSTHSDGPTNLNIVGVVTPDAALRFRHR